ncbi:MAG: hypothetical protein IPP06_07775 [Saprospiraceae bacterium]|nr:hypothetical protein [Candidatus Vicinibacter affinis]
MHFFNISISQEEFEKIIIANTKDQSDFWEKCYLGYVVGKPLPIRIIGKTVLKPYSSKDNDGNSRNYFGVRNYYVNVFGNKVKLASLGYMEQDSVVSVCATSAIWMMLQKASMTKYAVSKTPSQITDEADIVGTHGERIFPNQGLSVKQISQSIYKSGLVSDIRITYEDVEKIVEGVNNLLDIRNTLPFEWDITLQLSEQFKASSKTYDHILAKNIHCTSMPKYIWVAKCISNNKLLFEIIFDATDIAIGMFGFAIYFHNKTIKSYIAQFISKDTEKSSKFFHHACKIQFAKFILEESKKDYYTIQAIKKS